ncbi:flavodoxin family protein [Streptomyces stramineus]|uniref:NAD(P)H-dependent oxidoreductase n=1 Tax=Streptomyces stramineus TaxID=173861 RepID=A0ABN1B1Z9_9ACTN
MTQAGQGRSFLFVLGSAREGGNTETLAREAAAQLPSGVEQNWLRLSELPLPAFEDLRHADGRPRPEPQGNERTLLDATLAATDLVIASPLYWYNLSATTKLYLDYWAGWLDLPEARFRDRMRGRTLWTITTTSYGDDVPARPMLSTLRFTADFLGMHWGGSLVGHGIRPGDIQGSPALTAAKSFFGTASA